MIASILKQLERLPDRADFEPYRAALLAAAEHREAIVPALIAAIDHVCDLEEPEEDDGDDLPSLHEFAVLLLAQFRERRALDVFLRLFSLPDDRGSLITGDLTVEKGAVLLCSVCGGDPAPLHRLIHNEQVSEEVREQAVLAIGVQWLWGERTREEIVAEWKQLFQTLPQPGSSAVWTTLAGAVCEFNLPELAPEVRQAYAQELVDEDLIDAAEFEKGLFHRNAESDDLLTTAYAPIDAIQESELWENFLAGPPLTVPEILHQLERAGGDEGFDPYAETIRAALKQREAIVPELIGAVERACAEPKRFLGDPVASLHRFAVLLLAQFQEPRACDAVLRLYSLPDEQGIQLTADLAGDRALVVLASVCGGDPAPLLRLICDENVHEHVRAEAVAALAVQMRWGQRSREALVEELRRLFQTLPKPGSSYLWSALAGVIADFQIVELAPEVRQAFAEKLVNTSTVTRDAFEERLASKNKEQNAWVDEHIEPIDAAEEAWAWPCFEEFYHESVEPCLPVAPIPAVPFVAPPKPGRNDPCPCGSGKKYKKCCG